MGAKRKLILLLLVLTVTALSAGCGGGDNNAENGPAVNEKNESNANEAAETPQKNEENQTAALLDGYELPEMDFGGYEFTFLIHKG